MTKVALFKVALFSADPFEEFVEERRQAIDQMIWQVPRLSVAAQAFLYVVALNSDVSDLVRMLAATIAFIAAVAAVQLLLKRRGVHPLEGLGMVRGHRHAGCRSSDPRIRL